MTLTRLKNYAAILKGLKLIPAFEVIVSKNNTVIDLGTLVDEYEEEITIHTIVTDKSTGKKSIVAGKEVNNR